MNTMPGRIATGLLVASFAGAAVATPVHVQVDQGGKKEYGAGYSVSNGTACFVVTPHHVVETAQRDEITVTDAAGRQAVANVFKESPEYDAALLKVSEPVNIDCPQEWSDGARTEQSARSAEWLMARKVNGTGGMRQTRWFVSTVSGEELKLEPYGAKDRLEEGDSGSSVYAGEELLGMVVSTGTGDGTVTVVTQNQLFALFNAELAPSRQQVALLQPVYYRNQVNPYATVAAREYLGSRTPLVVQVAAPGPRAAAALSSAEQVPAGVDFVVVGNILDVNTTREANPNYKPPSQRKDEGSIGTRLLKSLGDSLKGQSADARYYVTYNIDVEVQVLDVGRNSVARNLERRALRVPQRDGDDPRELEKSAIQQGVTQAMDLTFRKYGLPTTGAR
jgi:hypothetical protein